MKKLLTIAAATAFLGTITHVSPAKAFGLGALIQAASYSGAGQIVRPNDGEDYLPGPATENINQSAVNGRSKASGGNGTVVQGEGNVVNTQQVTHIHHHHYTTNNSSVNVNQPPRY